MRELTETEVWEFVASRRCWGILSTVGADGYPHSVPLGYFQLDRVLYCGCRAGTQKLKNLERNPKASLLLESGRAGSELTGVLFQGDAEGIVDPTSLLDIKQHLARQKGEVEPTEIAPGIAYIRLMPRRIVSWTR